MLFKYHVQKKQQSTGEVKLLSHGSRILSSQCPVQIWVVVYELCLWILSRRRVPSCCPWRLSGKTSRHHSQF